jgi:hypothetical protein
VKHQSNDLIKTITANLTGNDAVADLLVAVRPFALAGMEGMFAEGGAIGCGPDVQTEEAQINHADLLRAYVVWSVYDPLSRKAQAVTDPVLAKLIAEQDARPKNAATLAASAHQMARQATADWTASMAIREEMLRHSWRRLGWNAAFWLSGLVTGAMIGAG